MVKNSSSILVIGFNTRPLAYSLKKAGYHVYAVDFFGDEDLYPNVDDCLIVTEELGGNYYSIKGMYGKFLIKFSIDLLRKYSQIDYLLIGSGLDDDISSRELILNEIKGDRYKVLSVNNDLETIKNARNITNVYKILISKGYDIPHTENFESYEVRHQEFQFPFILKKRSGSGGINVYKITNETEMSSFITMQDDRGFKAEEWLIQEYIEGLPVSCTTISNGIDCEVVSINQQIIGEKIVFAPKDFMYCGNIVPANILKEDEKIISEISGYLTRKLGLKGINGFDFVLNNHYPYLMEINPRIPGSIRASECSLNLNFLDLHIRSFYPMEWQNIKKTVSSAKYKGFTTKLIMFAPKEVSTYQIEKINKLEHIHDKTKPNRPILKGEPLCTVLFKSKDFAKSYARAIKVINKITSIIG